MRDWILQGCHVGFPLERVVLCDQHSYMFPSSVCWCLLSLRHLSANQQDLAIVYLTAIDHSLPALGGASEQAGVVLDLLAVKVYQSGPSHRLPWISSFPRSGSRCVFNNPRGFSYLFIIGKIGRHVRFLPAHNDNLKSPLSRGARIQIRMAPGRDTSKRRARGGRSPAAGTQPTCV